MHLFFWEVAWVKFSRKYASTMKDHPHINFDDIYSNDVSVIRNVIYAIEKIWNTSKSHGTVRRDL